jgi:pimeloyl-ACP methyl ester carboxylesterase
MSPGLERILMSIVSSDLSFWLATKFARNMVVRTVLATPPELLATASVEDKERVHRVMSGIQPISRRARGILNDARIGNSLTRFDLEKVRAPTLVLSVRDDLYGTFASAEYTAQQIRGARFVGYQTGGHMWVGHHSDVMAQISAFLQAPSTQAAEQARV